MSDDSITVYLDKDVKGFGRYIRAERSWSGCWTAMRRWHSGVKAYRFPGAATLTEALVMTRAEVPGARHAKFTRAPIDPHPSARPCWSAKPKHEEGS